MQPASAVTTFLFTDIEGSTRLWEQRARADAAGAGAPRRDRPRSGGSASRRGRQDDRRRRPRGLRRSARRNRRPHCSCSCALRSRKRRDGLVLGVRCGLHVGVVERRDNDFFGSHGQPCRTHHGRRAWRSGAGFAGGSRAGRATACPPGRPLRDLGPVRLRDLASPERVYQVVHPQLRQDFPALRSLEATPNNLPQQMTSFVGREHELADVRKLLGTARLLTLHRRGRHRQDAAVAAGCRRRPRRLSGRRVVRRAGAAHRRAAGAAGGGVGARRQGRGGAAA